VSTSNIGGSTGIGPKVLDDLGPECQLDHAGPFGSIGVARGELIASRGTGSWANTTASVIAITSAFLFHGTAAGTRERAQDVATCFFTKTL